MQITFEKVAVHHTHESSRWLQISLMMTCVRHIVKMLRKFGGLSLICYVWGLYRLTNLLYILLCSFNFHLRHRINHDMSIKRTMVTIRMHLYSSSLGKPYEKLSPTPFVNIFLLIGKPRWIFYL